MSGRREENPSPLAGEVAALSAAGEGHGDALVRGGRGSRGPSPDRALRARSTSPARGEGVERRTPQKSAVSPALKGNARALRQRTDAERKLWYALRDRRFAALKFRRQVPLGNFIADFVCFERRFIIEVDGGQHADSVRDQIRDRWLTANNFRVRRFWNNEVLRNLEGVMARLADDLGVPWS